MSNEIAYVVYDEENRQLLRMLMFNLHNPYTDWIIVQVRFRMSVVAWKAVALKR